MFKFLEKYVMGPMTKIAQLKLVRAIIAAGMGTIPFTIVGSMFLVLNVLPQVITPLQGFYDTYMSKITDVYMLANRASMGIIALYFLVIIGYQYTKITAEEEDLDLSPVSGMLLSIFGFFMLLPQFTIDNGLKLVNDLDNGIINGWKIGSAPSRMGAIGIFTAIIVGYVTVNIYKLCVKKNIVIKMPESVPQGVANSFSALLPTAFIAIIFIVVNGILISLGTDIYELISIPFGFVSSLTDTWLGVVVIYLLISLLWLVGIHGATIIYNPLTPIFLYNMEQNIAGANIPYAGEFQSTYVFIGGSGSMLVFILMLAFMSKSKQLKTLGKAAVIPGFFNINEPIIFGLPIVYNPNFAIPFIFAPMASASIAYFAIKLKLVSPLIIRAPWPTPVGLAALIGTGGDWRSFILAIVCALVAGLIYYPFFKRRDNELYQEELESLNN